MRKNNDLIRIYREVKKEVKEKENLQEVICYKEKLEKKIGNNKDIYLSYRTLCQGNSSIDVITLAVTLIAFAVSTVMTGIEYLEKVIPKSEPVTVFCIILLLLYVIWLILYIILKLNWLPLYRKASIILDEMYKEKFEQDKNHSGKGKEE